MTLPQRALKIARDTIMDTSVGPEVSIELIEGGNDRPSVYILRAEWGSTSFVVTQREFKVNKSTNRIRDLVHARTRNAIAKLIRQHRSRAGVRGEGNLPSTKNV